MEPDRNNTEGLGPVPRSEWPKVTEADLVKTPIERLKPGSELHNRLLPYLVERLEASERKMRQFYSRWQTNELKVQSYITLTDWDQRLKDMNDEGKPAKAVDIVVPYTHATVSTIVTYLMQAFTGRKPILQVGSYKPETQESAMAMEQMLQYHADHTRLVKVLWQFFQDSQIYNLGVMRCIWDEEQSYRTNPLQGIRTLQTTYAGNAVDNIDPFMFFPDPNVPMTDVNKRGEYVFWRNFCGMHELRRKEADGQYAYIDFIGTMPRSNNVDGAPSYRSLSAAGQGHPGSSHSDAFVTRNYTQLDTGSVEIIPAELGLGEETRPEKWLFTIANKSQIIQAEPLNYDHDMHPVCVAEPYGTGYGFGHAGLVDLVGPLQDMMSWLVNSHIQNVRTAINNMFLVDPSRIEMQDILNPKPAKLIRLKRASYGTDVREAIQQMQVFDVTGQHMKDLQVFMQLADGLSGVSDNMRGLQADGGRKTATEVRTASEAGASRLAALTRIVSSQAIVDLCAQMSINTQQLMTDEQWIKVLGQDGIENALRISPEMLAGDFNYPVNDGTLPIDRVAMVDVWKELLMGMGQDPQLAQQYDRSKIFEWIAELSGAKNLKSFKMQVLPDEQVQQMAQAGDIVPTGQTPGVASNPGDRLAGAQNV